MRGLSVGLWYMVASTFFFSVMSVLVKLGGEHGFASAQLVFARALVALVMSWVALRRAGVVFWRTPHWRLLMLRGVLGFLGLTCFFYAVTALPLADATVIQYTNPALVTVLAAIFLGERFGWRGVAGLLICTAGVLAVVRPSFLFDERGLDAVAVGVAILGAVMSAAAYTTVRALRGKAEPMLVVFYFPLIATPLSLPWAARVWVWPDVWGWLILLGVGVATQVAQVFMTRGLHLEDASRATAMTYLQVVFAFVWGVTLFDEIPTVSAIVGSGLVIAGALVIVTHRRDVESR